MNFGILFFRFRRKKSSNDWLLASAKAMDIEVDEDLYPLVKERATSLCFQKKGETQNLWSKMVQKSSPL